MWLVAVVSTHVEDYQLRYFFDWAVLLQDESLVHWPSTDPKQIWSALRHTICSTAVISMDGGALPTDIAAALTQLDEELAEGDITRKGYLKRRTQLFAATGLSTYLDYNSENFGVQEAPISYNEAAHQPEDHQRRDLYFTPDHFSDVGTATYEPQNGRGPASQVEDDLSEEFEPFQPGDVQSSSEQLDEHRELESVTYEDSPVESIDLHDRQLGASECPIK